MALQGVSDNPLGFDGGLRHFPAMQQLEGIDVMNHLDVVAAPYKAVCQASKEDRVAAEVKRRIEGSDECDA